MSLVVIELADLNEIISKTTEAAVKSALENLKPGTTLPEKLLSQKELCEFLKISAPTVIQLKKKGKIPFMQIGSDIRYDLKKVLESLEANNSKQ